MAEVQEQFSKLAECNVSSFRFIPPSLKPRHPFIKSVDDWFDDQHIVELSEPFENIQGHGN